MILLLDDHHFMREALKEANKAFVADEIPVGAIIVCNQHIIARAHNMTQQLNDVTAHAEMLVFTSAASYLNSKYLLDCTLYVTLEPCIMCAGASFWTQIPRIVFGAHDKKRGFLRTHFNMLHPTTEIIGGIEEGESTILLKEYFLKKREK